MADLASFQAAFAEAILAPEPIGRIARLPGFAVYRNTSMHAAVDALRAGFPTIMDLLGEEAFSAAALAFCTRQFPRSPVLAHYGAGFASWLARQPWTGELPYLADVARLDRLWLECHLASDVPQSTRPIALLPGTSRASGLRLALHPTARLAWLETPAVTIWQAHRQAPDFEELEPEWRAEGALFLLRAGRVECTQNDRATHRLLLAIAAGTTVNDTAAALAAVHPDVDPADLFKRMIALGALQPC